MKIKMALTAGACLLGLAAAPASAATEIVSNGILTGAKGVMVDGVSYNVSFVDGTCASVFGACSANNFAFKNYAGATLAAQALLDQVLINTTLGDFDSKPYFTRGCDFSSCLSFIPYGISNDFGFNRFVYASALNQELSFTDSTGDGSSATSFDTGNSMNTNFARFDLAPMAPTAGAVPEPATWAMMIVGFGLVGSTMRRRKAAIATRVRFA